MHIDELKAKLHEKGAVLDVVSRYVRLKRKGSEYLGLCPFHNERTPSFSVNPQKNIFKCFGCGASGDAIEFVKKKFNLPFPEAMAEIAKTANIPIEVDRLQSVAVNRTKWQNDLANIRLVQKADVLRTLNRYEINSFALSLADRWGSGRVLPTLIKYGLGTAKNGAAIFWQIDKSGNGRTAQVILYDRATAKRVKSVPPSKPKDEKGFPLFTIKHGFYPCFFGEHLLAGIKKTDVVCIVESEKTAIIASFFFPEVSGKRAVWIASGGNNGITEAKSQVLKGLNVCLCPDFSYLSRAVWGLLPMRRDEAGKFSETGEIDPEYISRSAFLQSLGCKVSFFDPYPDKKNNSDLADVLIGRPLSGEKPALIEPDFESLLLTT